MDAVRTEPPLEWSPNTSPRLAITLRGLGRRERRVMSRPTTGARYPGSRRKISDNREISPEQINFNITIRGQWMYPRSAVTKLVARVMSGLIDFGHYETVEFPF